MGDSTSKIDSFTLLGGQKSEEVNKLKVIIHHQCVKVNLSRNHHADTRGKYSSYSFLTLALDEGEQSASCPGHALPPEKEEAG
jgi:hypothetical protein